MKVSQPTELMEAQAARVIQMFSNPRAYEHPVDSLQMVETHISWVFLTGAIAYKVKKPVKLPFVDFSTLALRQKACEDEIRLNRRLAPSLYIDVVTMGGTECSPTIHGSPPLEFAVKMRQFDPAFRLDRQLSAKRVHSTQAREFAVKLARFHETLPRRNIKTADQVIAAFYRNLEELDSQLETNETGHLDPIRAWLGAHREELHKALNERNSMGFIRACHSDLHLENLVLLDGEITAFDALEFSEELRFIDLIDEVGFLVMDFLAHNRLDLAYEFLGSYLERSGDYSSLYLITFYMIHRALVRAKVLRLRQYQVGTDETSDAQAYLRLAARLGAGAKPLLLITHGFSGSGKTHLSQQLISKLPAIVIRSDIERKRSFGLSPGSNSGSSIASGIYSPKASQDTYERLERYATAALSANLNVIVDASFLKLAMRQKFWRLATRLAADFVILDCRAPGTVLADRIEQRKSSETDASEATIDVLSYQSQIYEELTESERERSVRINTTPPMNAEMLVEKIAENRSHRP